MERRCQPRISWKGESIISGIVFAKSKFVAPTRSQHHKTRMKLLMVGLQVNQWLTWLETAEEEESEGEDY